jgi:hypothetical protein
MKEELIAPCGMNCGICMAYLRSKERCPGCRGDDAEKKITVLRCFIKNCETPETNESGFCYECAEYPCKKLKHLDKRYRTKYYMSMIENLENIRENGLAAFIEEERERWRCPKCGGVICCHKGYCYECGEKINQS